MGNYFSAKKRILVPKDEGYEIKKGLLEMKRDINLKLVFYLGDDDNKIRQVFFFFFFFFCFIYFFSFFW
jgi:hypothetical protein